MNSSRWSTIFASVFDLKNRVFQRTMLLPLKMAVLAILWKLLRGAGIIAGLELAALLLSLGWLFVLYERFALAYRRTNENTAALTRERGSEANRRVAVDER